MRHVGAERLGDGIANREPMDIAESSRKRSRHVGHGDDGGIFAAGVNRRDDAEEKTGLNEDSIYKAG